MSLGERQPPPKYWFLSEAISWLAFGEAHSADELAAEWNEFRDRWRGDPRGWLAKLPYPDGTPKTAVDGRQPSTEKEVAEALNSEIFGPGDDANEFVALRRRLEEELAARASRDGAYRGAQSKVLQALRAGILEAEGTPAGQATPVAIKASSWNGRVEIKQDRLLRDHRVVFHGVQVLREQALSLKEGADGPSAGSNAPRPSRKGVGGRKEEYPWDDLKPVIAKGGTLDGFDSFDEMYKFALEWIDNNWGHLPKLPDPKTVQRQVEKYDWKELPRR